MPRDASATLNAIAKDIGAVKRQLQGVSKTQESQAKDISVLIQWKRDTELAKKIIDEYKQQEQNDKYQKSRASISSSRAELLKYLVPLIIAITLLIYTLTAKL